MIWSDWTATILEEGLLLFFLVFLKFINLLIINVIFVESFQLLGRIKCQYIPAQNGCILNLEEEYLYEDKRENTKLWEAAWLYLVAHLFYENF